jgi:hypothetical protein
MQPGVITDFFTAAQNLREAMELDLPLNDVDRICVENYIFLIQVTYFDWKRRNLEPPAPKAAA